MLYPYVERPTYSLVDRKAAAGEFHKLLDHYGIVLTSLVERWRACLARTRSTLRSILPPATKTWAAL
jgi:hypothetical protein